MAETAKFPYFGYTLYVVLHKKEGRRLALLVNRKTKHRTSMAYARYLMSVKCKRRLKKTEQVDHINNEKLDDTLSNLQIISQLENIRKSKKEKRYKKLTCPVCACMFVLEARQLHKKNEPSCSRKCGGIKSHWRRSPAVKTAPH